VSAVAAGAATIPVPDGTTPMTDPASSAVGLPFLVEGLPPRPPASLDPLLDAASICLAASGPSRTTMSDIAREMGVAPSTVSRKVGSVENAAWLIASREAHRFFERLPQLIAGAEGPRMVTVFLAAGVRAAREHPVFARILRDEPDFVGRNVTRRLPSLIEQVAAFVEPFLQMAMSIGLIREQDPAALSAWLTRVTVICLVAPPEGDLEDALDHLLLPLLAP
jgi:AcrR family transcriptional regulator